MLKIPANGLAIVILKYYPFQITSKQTERESLYLEWNKKQLFCELIHVCYIRDQRIRQ